MLQLMEPHRAFKWERRAVPSVLDQVGMALLILFTIGCVILLLILG
ncbi:hypothetical protein [Nguyenibacter vanlangensis]|uniref:Uncharacterized protein n=1 Tax=Nguyenibacter vanlangensis TaxID=1216886 RepID=A0A7Y7M7J3_9PROT|nr:hypothetical protein [Nguyenibacter vanlangensis]NVN11876.1 hypothetical protein [Nguyenibacter vanlangensis]